MSVNIDKYTYAPTKEHGIVAVDMTLGNQFRAVCRCGIEARAGATPSAAFGHGRAHVQEATAAPLPDSGEPPGPAGPAPVPAARKTPSRPGTKPPCACLCGGITGGGRYLPGHDSRHLKNLTARINSGDITLSDALLVLEASPKLAAKLAKRLSS